MPGLNLLINALHINQDKGLSHSATTTSVSGGTASYNQPILSQAFQSLHSAPSDINSVLVYNIAALSYQTQQYGQSLLYLKLLLENLD